MPPLPGLFGHERVIYPTQRHHIFSIVVKLIHVVHKANFASEQLPGLGLSSVYVVPSYMVFKFQSWGSSRRRFGGGAGRFPFCVTPRLSKTSHSAGCVPLSAAIHIDLAIARWVYCIVQFAGGKSKGADAVLDKQPMVTDQIAETWSLCVFGRKMATYQQLPALPIQASLQKFELSFPR